MLKLLIAKSAFYLYFIMLYSIAGFIKQVKRAVKLSIILIKKKALKNISIEFIILKGRSILDKVIVANNIVPIAAKSVHIPCLQKQILYCGQRNIMNAPIIKSVSIAIPKDTATGIIISGNPKKKYNIDIPIAITKLNINIHGLNMLLLHILSPPF